MIEFIPFFDLHTKSINSFRLISDIGKRLAELHLNYETCPKYPVWPMAHFGKLEKMKWKKDDKTILMINNIKVFKIPKINYKVNGRTPIEWAIDRYKRTVDKDSGIVNDPTENMTEEKTIAMIQRLTYVGIESDRLVALISCCPFESDQPPKNNLDKYFE